MGVNLHSLNNVLSRFSGTWKSNKNSTDNYCASIDINMHSLPYLYWHYKLVLRLAGVFVFLQMTLLLNKFVHPWLIICVKKHEWERSIAAKKKRFFASNAPLGAQMRNATRPFAQWNLISSTCNIPNHWKSTKTRSYLN